MPNVKEILVFLFQIPFLIDLIKRGKLRKIITNPAIQYKTNNLVTPNNTQLVLFLFKTKYSNGNNQGKTNMRMMTINVSACVYQVAKREGSACCSATESIRTELAVPSRQRSVGRTEWERVGRCINNNSPFFRQQPFWFVFFFFT